MRLGADIAAKLLDVAVGAIQLAEQHKVGVAAKEMRETVFWLAVIRRSGWARPDLHRLLEQVRKLAAILAACKRTARRGAG